MVPRIISGDCFASSFNVRLEIPGIGRLAKYVHLGLVADLLKDAAKDRLFFVNDASFAAGLSRTKNPCLCRWVTAERAACNEKLAALGSNAHSDRLHQSCLLFAFLGLLSILGNLFPETLAH